MLEYFKTILTKVSFDARLFERELRKAIRQVVEDQLEDLRNWCYNQFEGQHRDILIRCFGV